MYRNYENPWKLEEELEEAKTRYTEAIEAGEDEDALMYLAMEIAELEERVNFAWQDQEYDEDYAYEDFAC